jgi:hypothetical protein
MLVLYQTVIYKTLIQFFLNNFEKKVKTMKLKEHKAELVFCGMFVLLMLSMGLNAGFQSDWGNIVVDTVEIRAVNGEKITGKLYLPAEASATNPLPGVLAIHGYNNDKDVQRPHSLELAKRGIVVLAIDVLNHGDSDENRTDGSSALPYEAYDWLEAQPFVNPNLTGIVGHSMGAYYAAFVAMGRPQIDVVGYQAFAPSTFAPALANSFTQTNWIQIWSSAEEFGRAYNETVEAFEARGEAGIIANTAATGVGDGTGLSFHTYGNISAGTAQRYVYIPKTHPAQTHDLTATKEITSFFLQSLTGISEIEANESVAKTTFIVADYFGAISALVLMLSIIPLAAVLMKTKMFKEVEQPMPEVTEEKQTKEWLWWLFATVNFIIGALVFALNTSAPSNSEGVISWWFDGNMIEKWFPSMKMAIANGWEAFYIVNAVINMIIMAVWFFAYGRKKGYTSYDLGISYKKEKFSIISPVFLKTIGLGLVIFLYMYGITAFGQWAWTVEIRGPWSMFKVFTTTRSAQFWRYYWGPLLFWIFNAGMWLFGLMRQKEHNKKWVTILVWWLKICFTMLLGIILLNFISYLPLVFGWSGPWLSQFNFAPMMLLQTWAFIPTAAVMLLIAVFFYRKTGRVYLSALVMAALGTWIMVTGTINS